MYNFKKRIKLQLKNENGISVCWDRKDIEGGTRKTRVQKCTLTPLIQRKEAWGRVCSKPF